MQLLMEQAALPDVPPGATRGVGGPQVTLIWQDLTSCLGKIEIERLAICTFWCGGIITMDFSLDF